MAKNVKFGDLGTDALVLDFTFADVPGPVKIGTVRSGHLVRNTVVRIDTAFDGGLELTIGDMIAQGRLQTISDNQPEFVNHWNVNNVYEYTSTTDVYIFFPNGTPTQGVGRVIVYLD